eukprot:CAMPEP_0174376492 /NCGR_PEP_ID=MMETSP0811_2-20130205/118374_1 /TAXON_ID=73025 ORGANISM="Eutreptiella gymnastica-like, Strain CCMP1594" /NCGR_SAMPLE_ID=MMETSP0811_2 /ASSEMBLY_ACC=CAM_ASM_000667 /LENGTH=174 /DNA_ID=CAMNT_0015527715 /DNA_START=63 /DNA_END=584 /DNA_ORIENTATION=+
MARRKEIDDLTGLWESRVLLFCGTKDHIYRAGIVQKAADFYRHFVRPSNVRVISDVPSGHAIPVAEYGTPCGHPGPYFMERCGIDAAQLALSHIYGPLRPPSTGPHTVPTDTHGPSSPSRSQQWIAFNQSRFVSDGRTACLAPRGWLYVPKQCHAAPRGLSDASAMHLVNSTGP